MTNNIKEEFGDILTTSHGIIVHGCNIQGVMGAGLARQIRTKYPKVFEDYYREHNEDKLRLGRVIYTDVSTSDNILLVASCMTQEYYGKSKDTMYVDYLAIANCMHNVFQYAKQQNLPVHIPRIGAGYGGGNWDNIKERIIPFVYYDADLTFWEPPESWT